MLRWNHISLYTSSLQTIRGVGISTEFYIDFWVRINYTDISSTHYEFIKFTNGLDITLEDSHDYYDYDYDNEVRILNSYLPISATWCL